MYSNNLAICLISFLASFIFSVSFVSVVFDGAQLSEPSVASELSQDLDNQPSTCNEGFGDMSHRRWGCPCPAVGGIPSASRSETRTSDGTAENEARKGVTSKHKIVSKPRAVYTEAARANNTQGTVLLNVTLLASGQIGAIKPIMGLPDGLTEQAVEAAKRIRFEPKRVDGVPRSVTVTVEYSFCIY
jgi:TonB family protein